MKTAALAVWWFVGFALFGALVHVVANQVLVWWHGAWWPLTMTESVIVGLLAGAFVLMYAIRDERKSNAHYRG